mgnify:CR=1 FL=1
MHRSCCSMKGVNMALDNNAVCAICGKPYRVCNTCKEIKSFSPWRIVTDTLPHYMIYLTLCEFNKTQDKAKAKSELEGCDLSELDTFDSDVKTVINEILSFKQESIKNQVVDNKETKSKRFVKK